MDYDPVFLPAPTDSLSARIIEQVDANSSTIASLVKQGRYHELLDMASAWAIDAVGKVIIALVIFFAGRWIIKQLIGFQNRILSRRQMDITLKTFLGSMSSILAYAMLLVFIINVVGTHAVSLAALIAAAGLAIGLAVKDNLANFAGGVMLLLNKPFKGGDTVEVQGLTGTVKSIGILYTTLTTTDNKTIYIPNGPLSTGNIINYNSQRTRRVDITVGVDYGSNVEQVKSILMSIAVKHPLVLPDPEPFARMITMNSSSIDFVLRVWTRSENYWPVLFDLNEEIYEQFAEKGLNIPFPQMTIHLAQNQNNDTNRK